MVVSWFLVVSVHQALFFFLLFGLVRDTRQKSWTELSRVAGAGLSSCAFRRSRGGFAGPMVYRRAVGRVTERRVCTKKPVTAGGSNFSPKNTVTQLRYSPWNIAGIPIVCVFTPLTTCACFYTLNDARYDRGGTLFWVLNGS